MNWKDFVRMR